MPAYGSTFKRRTQRGYKPRQQGYNQTQIQGTGGTPNVVAPPPPPRPVAPPAPPPRAQPLPFDPQYEATTGNARRQYDTTNAGLAYQEGRVRQEYGFDDASDPFSRARMLERNFQQATRGRLNTAGNNLYSSSFNRGEAQGRFGYEQDVDTARKSYADALQAITQQRTQATVDRDAATTTAAAERVARAQEAREDPGPPPVPPPPPRAAPRPKPKARPKPKKKPKPKPGKHVRFDRKRKKGY